MDVLKNMDVYALVLSCMVWCVQPTETPVPKVKQVPCCINFTKDPWALWVFNKHMQWWYKCICLIKALWIFHTGLGWDCDWKYVDISSPLVGECYPLCSRYAKSHQFFMFAAQSLGDGWRHIFFQPCKYLMWTLTTNCPPRPITVATLWRKGWEMIVSHQLHFHIDTCWNV